MAFLGLTAPSQAAAQQTRDGAQRVEVFAPGTISVGNVYRGTFSPDGREFYFFKKVTEDEEDYRIFQSRLNEGAWTRPERLPLGGEFSDLYPAMSPDGQRMVFSSYRPAPGDTSGHPSAYLWYVTRTEEGWSEPVFMDGASTFGHYHSQISFDARGRLTFVRLTWNYRNKAEFASEWSGGRFEEPDTLDTWLYWRNNLPNGLRLFETAPGHDGSYTLLMVAALDPETGRMGQSDIWIAPRSGDTWGEARALGQQVNTEATENFPFFSPDGRMLYFVRDFNEFVMTPVADLMVSTRGR